MSLRSIRATNPQPLIKVVQRAPRKRLFFGQALFGPAQALAAIAASASHKRRKQSEIYVHGLIGTAPSIRTLCIEMPTGNVSQQGTDACGRRRGLEAF